MTFLAIKKLSYFEQRLLGRSLQEIKDQYEGVQLLSKGEYKEWYYVSEEGVKFFIYPKVDNRCRGISGYVGDIFGLNEKQDIIEFCDKNNFRYINPDGTSGPIGTGNEPKFYPYAGDKNNTWDLYNSSWHWRHGELLHDYSGAQTNGGYSFQLYTGKHSYFYSVQAMNSAVEPNHLCSLEYYHQYEYWAY